MAPSSEAAAVLICPGEHERVTDPAFEPHRHLPDILHLLPCVTASDQLHDHTHIPALRKPPCRLSLSMSMSAVFSPRCPHNHTGQPLTTGQHRRLDSPPPEGSASGPRPGAELPAIPFDAERCREPDPYVPYSQPRQLKREMHGHAIGGRRPADELEAARIVHIGPQVACLGRLPPAHGDEGC